MVAELDRHGLAARVAPEIEFSVFEEPIQTARGAGLPRADAARRTEPDHLPDLALVRPDRLHAPGRAPARRARGRLGVMEQRDRERPGRDQHRARPTPLSAADYVVRTKLALREVAGELGRSVTFMAMVDEHLGASMHVNLSLVEGSENAFYDGHGAHRGRTAAAPLAGRPAGDDAGGDVVLQPDRQLLPAPGRDRGPADDRHLGGGQQVDGLEDRDPGSALGADRAPRPGRRLQPVPGAGGDPGGRPDRDARRARASAAVRGDGLGPGGRTPRRGSPTRSPRRPRRWRPIGAWPRCSDRRRSTTGSAAGAGSG